MLYLRLCTLFGMVGLKWLGIVGSIWVLVVFYGRDFDMVGSLLMPNGFYGMVGSIWVLVV